MDKEDVACMYVCVYIYTHTHTHRHIYMGLRGMCVWLKRKESACNARDVGLISGL